MKPLNEVSVILHGNGWQESAASFNIEIYGQFAVIISQFEQMAKLLYQVRPEIREVEFSMGDYSFRKQMSVIHAEFEEKRVKEMERENHNQKKEGWNDQ